MTLSASAVSRQIAHLEQTLGVRLLERTTRRLRMSEAGSEVFERCKDMLDAAQAALDVGERRRWRFRHGPARRWS